MGVKFKVENDDGVEFITDNYVEAVNEAAKYRADHFKRTGQKKIYHVQLVKPQKGGLH